LRGASATETLLKDVSGANMRVFVVWEPVLATDLAAPSTATLRRVSSTRASQYWDKGRALSHVMGEHDRASVVWDYIAVYPPGAMWNEAPPKPTYSGHPVADVTSSAKQAINQLMGK